MRKIVAATEVLSDPPALTDFDKVDETLEPTEVLPDPYESVMFERVERPTIPITYSRVPLDSLEALINRRQG